MKYSINENSSLTAYMQLYEQLRSDIINGVIPYKGKLPSKRLLAEETGVSVITVEHAYSILKDEGYIEARERSGYFVIYRREDVIPLAEHTEEYLPRKSHTASDSEVFPYSVMAKTMRKVLTDYGEDILTRSVNKGCMELREALRLYLARSPGINVSADQIIIGSGAEYLYSLIIQLLGRDKVYGIEDPSYEKIKLVYEANGITTDMLLLGSDGIRSSELERTGAEVLHVTPFNSYPSGITAGASKRREYLRWAEKRGGYIIEDNYDSELTVSMKNDDTLFCMSERVIYLNTFSKTIAPSVRVGYMVLPESLAEKFENTLGFYSCTVPVFEQYVLAELINNGDFERHINRIRRLRRKNK